MRWLASCKIVCALEVEQYTYHLTKFFAANLIQKNATKVSSLVCAKVAPSKATLLKCQAYPSCLEGL